MSYIQKGEYVIEPDTATSVGGYYLYHENTRRDHLTDFLRHVVVPVDFVRKSAYKITYSNTATYTEYAKDGGTIQAFSVSFQMNKGKLTIFCPSQDLKKHIQHIAKALDQNLDEARFLAELHAALPESYGNLVRTGTGFSGSNF